MSRIPLQRLALSYAKTAEKKRIDWLFQLDCRLGDNLRQTREPMLAQLRLAWWRDMFLKDPGEWPRGEMLFTIAGELEREQPAIVAESVSIIDGWEHLLDDLPWSEATIAAYADLRGGTLFRLAAGTERDDPAAESVNAAGAAWAAWDAAANAPDQQSAACAIAAGRAHLVRFRANGGRLASRPLSILLRAAAIDIDSGRPGAVRSPRGWLRLVIHGLTGR